MTDCTCKSTYEGHPGKGPHHLSHCPLHASTYEIPPAESCQRFVTTPAPVWDDLRSNLMSQGETPKGRLALTDFTWDELLAEIKRRVDYDIRGWQDSYRSAEYWRRRAEEAGDEPA
jgi:hypothetical protein